MIRRSLGGALLAAGLAAGMPGPAPATDDLPRPVTGPGTNYAVDDPFTADRTRWWREDRFGMVIHFGVYSYLAGQYTRPDGTTCRDAEWIKRQCRIPNEEYERIAG